jgi:hypothetical protein
MRLSVRGRGRGRGWVDGWRLRERERVRGEEREGVIDKEVVGEREWEGEGD